jgi:hypothetical protein
VLLNQDPWVAAAAESSAFDNACLTPAPIALTAGNQQRAIANLDYTFVDIKFHLSLCLVSLTACLYEQIHAK